MGAKADCVCWYRGRSGRGVARLETDDLIFRGDLNLAIPFRSVISATASKGNLTLVFNGGEATFELGDKASKWASKILDPPSLMKKLGVKAGSAVGFSGARHDSFERDLKRITRDVAEGRMKKGRNLIFFGAEKKSDLNRLKGLKDYLEQDGAIWVLRPKGAAHITESDVMKGGKKAGLVDVKVARFSDTHTAEKLVIPSSQRTVSKASSNGTRKTKATKNPKSAKTRATKSRRAPAKPTKTKKKAPPRKKPTRKKPTRSKSGASKRPAVKKTATKKKPSRAKTAVRKKPTAKRTAVRKTKPARKKTVSRRRTSAAKR